MLYYTQMSDAVKRPSPLRTEQAAQTRARVLDAAQRLFAEQGFAGARIETIAAAAGVAVPTVYKVFTNKRNLLVDVLNRTLTGANENATVDNQSWWTEQLAEPDPERQLKLIARNARQIYERSAVVLEAVRAAAPLDRDIAKAWDQISADRLARSRRSATQLLAKAGRRARLNVDETALTLWSLTGPELYTSLTGAGRTAAQYERWLANILTPALLA